MGGGTLLVSLPKPWALKNGITKGSTVSVDELSERKLIVQPISDEVETLKRRVVEYPRDELSYVINDVTGAYLLGYDIISIEGRKLISREDRSKLKSTIGRLIGLEIMDEDSKRITLQFLLEPKAVDPQRIVRRMGGIIEGMLRDTAEGVSSSDARILSVVGERDDEVDRLYFLLVRTVRTATMNPELAERYKLAPVEVLDLRVLASYLESVGDAVAELSKELEGALLTGETSKTFSASLGKLIEMQDLALQSFLSRGDSRSRGTYPRINQLAKDISGMVQSLAKRGDAKFPRVIELLGLLERASKLLGDIADLSLPGYQLR